MAAHYYTVTWDQLHRDARALAWRLVEKGALAGVVACERRLLVVENVSIVTYAAVGAVPFVKPQRASVLHS